MKDVDAQFDLGAVTQPIDGQPRSNWQVPWDEHFLDGAGCTVREGERPDARPTGSWLRVAFFFHYLDFGRPLSTPWGELALPRETVRPSRLEFMHYEPPC